MLTSKKQAISRRNLLKWSTAGALGASVSGWFDILAGWGRVAAQEGVKHKSAILLWMDGGPSHTHSFDMKEKSEYKAIPTAVPGIQICEYLPRVAQQMGSMTLLRGMSTGEAEHHRARYLMHTGYRQGEGGVAYPCLPSIAWKELGRPEFELPNAVVISTKRVPTDSSKAGHLGPIYAPVAVRDPAKGMIDLKSLTDLATVEKRVGLIDGLDREFLKQYGTDTAEAHRKGYLGASRMLHSPKAKAFDIQLEPETGRKLYGQGKFAESCLLARRLIEVGVPFVEVSFPGFWDHHGGCAKRHKPMLEELDVPMAALIADLEDRGLLDNTLVIWMGEFGRTPINGGNHYARAWTTVLAGAGLKVGQVVGRTDAKGGTVEDRPVSAQDFMATICKALGIDYTKEYYVGNRPLRLVKKGGQPVQELFA